MESLTFSNILNEAINAVNVGMDDINQAIDSKRCVIIDYNDETKHPAIGDRLVEIYVFGLSKAGNPMFRAFQYDGVTKKGIPQWKTFRLDRVTKWELTDETFDEEPRKRKFLVKQYKSNDKLFSNIYNYVSFDKHDGDNLYKDYLNSKENDFKAISDTFSTKTNKSTTNGEKVSQSQNKRAKNASNNNSNVSKPNNDSKFGLLNTDLETKMANADYKSVPKSDSEKLDSIDQYKNNIKNARDPFDKTNDLLKNIIDNEDGTRNDSK